MTTQKYEVSTHSRAEAAGLEWLALGVGDMVSTHSRAEAAACVYRS